MVRVRRRVRKVRKVLLSLLLERMSKRLLGYAVFGVVYGVAGDLVEVEVEGSP
jgi:hypothetical protein